MKSFTISIAFLFGVASFSFVAAKYTLKYVRMCNDDAVCKVYATVKTIEGEQYIDANYTCPFEAGDNLRVFSDIYLLVGNQYKHVFHISENNFCFALQLYLGPLIMNMLKIAGRSLTTPCPIPAGEKLNLKNYKLDFTQMKMQFPIGTIRITVKLLEKSTEREMVCLRAELVASRS